MSVNENLTPKQRKAIAALISEPTQKKAAELAGVNEKTIIRWMAEGDFKAALREAESAAIDAATRRLIGLESLATKALRDVLTEPKIAPGVKVRAARSVLDYLLKLRELRTIEERLTELEESVREVKDAGQAARQPTSGD